MKRGGWNVRGEEEGGRMGRRKVRKMKRQGGMKETVE